MGQTNWDRVEQILDEALTKPKNTRLTFIEQQCGDNKQLKSWITELLESIESSEGFLETGSVEKDILIPNIIEDLPDEHYSSLVGKQLGAYSITKLIEHGGMGSIYLAERTDGAFHHKVAIKIIRRGMDTPSNIARFKQEQNILASLHHPHIGRLYDGGVTNEGLPYLVMEYINGQPIDEYCDEHTLSIDERLTLFRKVCNAVQYAHNNLVIHRDLKPANILITPEGQVKILDFGIAKLLDSNSEIENIHKTQAGAQMLTLAYAAPEQINHETITTAADNYALGIVLYKLLISVHPFEPGETKNRGELKKLITQKTAPKPSSHFRTLDTDTQSKIAAKRGFSPHKLVKLISGDLDAIVRKSLRKKAANRYNSIELFVEDLRRYGTDQPVTARAEHFRYVATKFLKRNKIVINTAAAFLIILIGLFSYHSIQVSQERNQAQLEAKKASAVTNFLTSMIEANTPSEAQGDTVSITDFLDSSFEEVQNLKKTPLVQAEVLTTMGRTYRTLGDIQKASTLINKALNILAKEQVKNAKIAKSYNVYGIIQRDLGNYSKSTKALQESINIYRHIRRKNTDEYIKSLRDLAYVERLQANYGNALTLIKEALKISKTLYKEPNVKTAETLFIYASILRFQKKYKSAITIQKESLEMVREVTEAPHPGIAANLVNLANLYNNKGKIRKAIELNKDALKMSNSLYGEEHQEIANISGTLSGNYLDAGKLDSAEQYLKKALKIQRKINPENPRLGNFYNKYAKIYFLREEYKLAETFLKKAQHNLEKKHPENHPRIINIKTNQAELAAKQNKFDKARKLLSEISNISKSNYNKLDNSLKKKIESLKKLVNSK
ncbi:serine/threonine-protein kinase [Fodinibius saliphilus]|uniref:serine/threonine-protein kinase n=1 Tax=Fodinibius saliphilus TaxID=1920650 RepID=UPI00110921C7|nr:serine/threonine-protein kinase [Fodinibius saliphilus]